MSTESRTERAQRWLNEQIEQLKALRNANTRDTEFKQWRQSTLTIIQRVWPGDAKHSARFRRIPFTPPSTRADARETREYYERGCAEGLVMLSSLLDDLLRHGAPAETATARPATLDPGATEDQFPTLNLPGGTGDREVPTAQPAAKPAAAKRALPERRKKSRKGGPRRRLRDMLGLDALQELGRNGEPTYRVAPAPDVAQDVEDAVPACDATRAPVAPDARPDVPTLSAGDLEQAPVPAPVPVAGDDVAVESSPVSAVDEPDSDAAGGDMAPEAPTLSADEFLRSSPVFMSAGRPVQRPKRELPAAAPARADDDEAPRPMTVPTAIAMAAVAAEVARLGVPEGQRASIRASLIRLSETLEDGSLDWKSLRESIDLAMEFPPIARRVIPLLIPFLDKAA
jgi:hypothetical protein